MTAAVTFVLYLLALIVFMHGAGEPIRKRQPYTAVHLACLGLTLVSAVWVIQAAQAAF